MQTGSIGPIVFATSTNRVFTWKDASFEASARYARHEVFGRKQLLEFTGPDVETFSLTIHLNGMVGVTPDTEIARLKEIVLSGKEQLCVLGGNVLGWFVIESMSAPVKRTDGRGKTLVADVTLNLTEYVREPAYSNTTTESSSLVTDDLMAAASELQNDIVNSELSGAFMGAMAATESAMGAAMDVANGVVASVSDTVSTVTGVVEGAVSTAVGFVEDAVSTVTGLASTVMTPANIALASMQGVVDAANSIAPMGLDAVSQKITAVRNITAIADQAQSLVSGKAENVRALLARATADTATDSLRTLVKEVADA